MKRILSIFIVIFLTTTYAFATQTCEYKKNSKDFDKI
jgi:hypothetical protein